MAEFAARRRNLRRSATLRVHGGDWRPWPPRRSVGELAAARLAAQRAREGDRKVSLRHERFLGELQRRAAHDRRDVAGGGHVQPAVVVVVVVVAAARRAAHPAEDECVLRAHRAQQMAELIPNGVA